MARIHNRAGLTAAELAGLEAQVGGLESLADVVAWGRAQPAGSVRPPVIVDVIIQDEFTHDAIVPLRDGRTLVFGST